jgi:membrane-associated phospholipid phosphatase
MAKVMSDYHPELGNKKYWLYAAALVPPAFVGIYRIKALKHFPTDVIMGTAVGAAVGILIPHFHKLAMRKNKDLSVVPFAGGYSGLAFSYKF